LAEYLVTREPALMMDRVEEALSEADLTFAMEAMRQ